MNKTALKNIFTDLKLSVTRHSPEILTGIGIAGMITTTILAVGATPKALMIIEDRQYDKGEELTGVEKVKAAWKCYIPAIITCATSTACLIGASSVNLKRNAALATAYKLSEEALSTYKEKVIETIGEKKEQTVRDKVAKEKLDDNPISTTEVYITQKGETLCYDSISGRYFKSDLEKIKKAVNELNRRMMLECYISLSEFYDELGLKHTKTSDDLGWNLNLDGLIEIDYRAQIAEDGNPCIVLDYYVAPRYDFSKLM